MPYLETVDELVEWLADKFGIYGVHEDTETKPCRICWTAWMKGRIWKATSNESVLKR